MPPEIIVAADDMQRAERDPADRPAQVLAKFRKLRMNARLILYLNRALSQRVPSG